MFANRFIASEVPILDYCGELITKSEADDRGLHYKSQGIYGDYMVEAATDIIIDATFSGNFSRYANHGCRPNARLQTIYLTGSTYPVVWLFSMRPILAGQEILVNYAFYRDATEDVAPCNCGRRNCDFHM